jgi:hypothetical protein
MLPQQERDPYEQAHSMKAQQSKVSTQEESRTRDWAHISSPLKRTPSFILGVERKMSSPFHNLHHHHVTE